VSVLHFPTNSGAHKRYSPSHSGSCSENFLTGSASCHCCRSVDRPIPAVHTRHYVADI